MSEIIIKWYVHGIVVSVACHYWLTERWSVCYQIWWPFWLVRRSSEFGELRSLWLRSNDRQSSPIQIVNNIRITAILHCRTGEAYRSHRRVKRGRCGAPHKACCQGSAGLYLASLGSIYSSNSVLPMQTTYKRHTSIIAASRYLRTLRMILMATVSLCFLSQHSSTRPKVPSPIKLRILSANRQW